MLQAVGKDIVEGLRTSSMVEMGLLFLVGRPGAHAAYVVALARVLECNVLLHQYPAL